MKIKVTENHCKGCPWLKQGLCMFERCVKKNGFTIDKGAK